MPPEPGAAQVPLAGYTTLGLGGPARRFAEAPDDAELIAQVRAADERGDPLLVLGGGSNLVVADEGFPGIVVHVATRGIRHRPDGESVLLTVAAGEDWDPVVAGAVADGLAGLECLAGIPGLTGATPIQNVGAYGQEVAQTLVTVRAYDRVPVLSGRHGQQHRLAVRLVADAARGDVHDDAGEALIGDHQVAAAAEDQKWLATLVRGPDLGDEFGVVGRLGEVPGRAAEAQRGVPGERDLSHEWSLAGRLLRHCG